MRLDQRFELPPKTRERGRKITVWMWFVAWLSTMFGNLSLAARRHPEELSWVPRLELRYLTVLATATLFLFLLAMLGEVVFAEGKPDLPKEP